MCVLLQPVTSASVSADGKTAGEIGRGWLVLLVSQFTLFAETSSGRLPRFTDAAGASNASAA